MPVLDGAAGVLADGEGREALLGVPVARDTPCITSGRMCTCNGAYVGDAQKWLLSVAHMQECQQIACGQASGQHKIPLQAVESQVIL